jgi:Flp pilus assembly protein TadG
MNRSPRSQRDDRGVVAIEVVIVMPILLMLIIGTVVLGNFLNLKTQTSGLARDGARDAALNQTPRAGTVIVAGGCNASSDPLTDTVTVQATKAVTLRSIPLLPALLPDTITETVTMRCGG